MSSYGLEEIIRRWGHHKLTEEQAIGQILLLLKELFERVERLEVAQGRQRRGTPESPAQ